MTDLKIPGYEIGEKIFESKSTLILRGRQVVTGMPIVLKILKPEAATAEWISRFRHEFEILSELSTPGVIKAYGLEQYDGSLILVLEDINGTSLDRAFAGRPAALGQFLLLASRIAGVLGSIHHQGIIHRNLNPSHVLWNRESGQLRITDFGLAEKLPRRGLQPPTTLEGNLAYVSPEQTGRMNRSVDYRSDLYSLGVILYQLLTGSLPFSATDPLEMIHSHLARQPVPPAELDVEIPAVVSRIVMKLLAKMPEDRYQTAWGLQTDLEECLSRLEAQGTVDQFPLGRKDVPEELHVPLKIYDREEEIGLLRSTFRHVATGSVELFLVAGQPGIGKTALVTEVYRSVLAMHGLFISGKFDQYLRIKPYSAIVTAFKDLVRQLLSESDEALAAWKKQLQAALGTNGQVITDVIPEMELIIGPQPPVPQVSSTESQNRFNMVFGSFVKVFSVKEHPLVMFLDDLQWIDPASLRLIEVLLTDPDMHHLLIAGAYRNTEIGPDHVLIRSIDDLRMHGVVISTITLGPLSEECVNQMIADALRQDPATVESLAAEIYRKTGGNPFFVHQLLLVLQHDGLIYFDRKLAAWRWRLEDISAMPVTDNVIDLVVKALNSLPPTSRRALSLAACIGSRFTLKDMATITKRSPEEVYADLVPAIDAGLVIPYPEPGRFTRERVEVAGPSGGFAFLHDRVQQAAIGLLSRGERKEVHLQIGRLLLTSTPDEERDERIFEIVDHLDESLTLIGDARERLETARLNLVATRKAKDATAWDAARRYSSHATELLPADVWESEYDLAFAAHRERAESEFLTGHHSLADEIFRDTILRSRSRLDKAEIYNLCMRLYQVAGRYAEGSLLGQEALRLFEVDIPLDPEGNRLATQAELSAISEGMKGMHIADLADLPVATSPENKAVMSLLMNMCPCVYIGMPAVFFLLPLKMISNSLKYGNTEESSYGYSVNGFMQISAFDDLEAAYEYSKVALRLNEKFDDRKLRGTLYHLHGDHFNYWTNHISTDFPWLENGFQACLEVGDLMYSSYIAFQIVWQAFERGDNPLQVIDLSRKYEDFARRINNEAVLETIRLQQRFMLSLAGKTESPTSLGNGDFSEAASLERVTEASFGCGIEFFHVARLILYYLYGDYEQALKEAESAGPMLGAISAMPAEAAYYFYYALTLAATYSAAKPEDRDHLLTLLETCEGKIGRWSRHCPANFLHKYLLVRAEKAKVLDRPWEAVTLYSQAAASARENGYVQYEALANERAGEFWLAAGREEIARLYLTRAIDCYVRWGATAKADDLRRRHRSTIALREEAEAITPETLDLASAMKASRAISSQIVPEALLKTLMNILIENAGAERGLLLLEQDGQLVIKAEGQSQTEEGIRLLAEPLKERHDLPKSIVKYVQRTRESIVLDNAAVEGQFTADPYVVEHKPKSILCLPILRQKKPVGVLYLENNLATGVFTPGRLQILEVLCAQAAISIENASLYASREETIGELQRTDQALRRSRQLLQSILDNSPAVIYVKDNQGKYILINRRFEELFHVSKEQLIGKTDYDLFSGDAADKLRANDLIVIRSGKPYETEEIVPQDDGLHTYISIKYPLFDADGKIYAISGISTDISDRKKTEEALRESEERFRTLAETSPASIVVYHKKFLYVNHAFEMLTGYSESEILNMNFWDIIHPEYRELVKQRGLTRLEGKEAPSHYEAKITRKDGQERWIDISTTLFHYEGQAAGLAVSIDITDRKRMEEALRISEIKYRIVADNTYDWEFWLNPEKEFVYISPSCERITGYKADEFTADPGLLHRTIYPRDVLSYLQHEQEVFHTRKPGELEFRIVRRDGTVRWIYHVCQPVFDDQDNYMGIRGSDRDITDRKQAEEELRDSEERFRTLVEQSPISVQILSPDGRTLQVNRAFEKLWGLTLDDLKDYNILQDKELQKLGLIPYVKKAFSGETSAIPVAEYDARESTGKGLKRWVHSSAYPVKDNAGRIRYVIIMHEDVGERVRYERELADAKARADAYLDLMGHDITNMNQIGSGYLELAMESLKDAEELKELLKKPLEIFSDSSELIENVKKLQQVMAGESRLEKVDLGQTLWTVVSQYLSLPGRDITIHYTPVTGYLVLANDLLKDAFSNLLGNAIRYSTGSLVIEVSLARTVLDNVVYYEVVIEDNGPGIPDEIKRELFSRFEKGKTRTGSRGLEMALVKALVDSYHGSIAIEDRVPGDYRKGSRIVVLLPAAV